MSRGPSTDGDGAFFGIAISHVLFVLCGATYFVYWALQESAPGSAAGLFFFLSILCGFGGAMGGFAATLAVAVGSAHGETKLWRIYAGCTAIFFAVYYLTSGLMDRPFTSELVFAMIWAAVELGALHASFVRGWLYGKGGILAVASVSIAILISLVCYAVYFLLVGRSRFYAGLIPYGAVSVAMLTAGVVLVRSRNKRL